MHTSTTARQRLAELSILVTTERNTTANARALNREIPYSHVRRRDSLGKVLSSEAGETKLNSGTTFVRRLLNWVVPPSWKGLRNGGETPNRNAPKAFGLLLGHLQ
ncbi:MAG: hypothetical protein Aurels2KO_24670 [Aureliella sp.]